MHSLLLIYVSVLTPASQRLALDARQARIDECVGTCTARGGDYCACLRRCQCDAGPITTH